MSTYPLLHLGSLYLYRMKNTLFNRVEYFSKKTHDSFVYTIIFMLCLATVTRLSPSAFPS